MKALLAVVLAIVCCALYVKAAPAGSDQQKVQFLKYRNDQDFEAIMRQIIAQYDQLGGTSQFHERQSARIIDPTSLKINV